MRYQPLSPSFYSNNRARIIEKLEPESVLLMHSSDLMPRNGDCHYTFRQHSDFLYLCGIDQEESVLLIDPSGKNEKREILFIKKTNEYVKIWEGEKLSKAKARELSGIENVQWVENFETVFFQLIAAKRILYYNNIANERAVAEVQSRMDRFLQKNTGVLKGKKLVPVGTLIADFRVIKQQEEVLQMQRAIEITGKAFRRILKTIKPKVWEFEIEADISHEFTRNRASGHAYQPIVAAGKNSCVLHYIQNDQQCQAGEVLLLDFGAEYGNYAADLSRTIPVSGKFSARQLDVYKAVLQVFYVAKENMVVGNTIKNLQEKVVAEMKVQLVNLGLLSKKESGAMVQGQEAYKKYFMHGVAHFLGMDVHDVGNRNAPFRPGMVLTCEPGIYIQEEGIGIRLENDILITEKGPVDLMANIPLDPEQIEALMNQ